MYASNTVKKKAVIQTYKMYTDGQFILIDVKNHHNIVK